MVKQVLLGAIDSIALARGTTGFTLDCVTDTILMSGIVLSHSFIEISKRFASTELKIFVRMKQGVKGLNLFLNQSTLSFILITTFLYKKRE